jgi:hypothetical protein
MPVEQLSERLEIDRATYERDGLIIVRRMFRAGEMDELAGEADRLLADGQQRVSPDNLRCRYREHYETGEPLFEVFDPVIDIAPVCERFSADRRLVAAVESLYGEPACLFKDKLIVKPAGAMGYPLHQDIPLAWPGFPATFLTVLIPIDACSPENGCTQVFRGYHRGHLSDNPAEYMLPDEAVDVSRRVDLDLAPGDVALFHGLAPHRSDPNRTSRMRRTLFLSFNARSDGGDQRGAHYSQFQQMTRERLLAAGRASVYFR